MRWFNRISFKYATQLLPVSKSLIFTENTYFFNPDQPLHFGVRAAFPSLMPHYTVVHNGIDLDFWAGDEGVEKTSGSFITVASAKQLKRKGVDLIIEAAALLPESHFTIIGAECPKDLKVTSNVDFVGKLPQSALVEHYKKAQFYLQLSSFEGFGLSLCEAMLCGCTPIGSDVNYIPTIIGDTGYVLALRDMDALIELLEKAMMDHPIATWNEAARQRIIANYSAKKRQEELYNILAGN
jgi:glycosyltransferase involved in cell wall biosynthesis